MRNLPSRSRDNLKRSQRFRHQHSQHLNLLKCSPNFQFRFHHQYKLLWGNLNRSHLRSKKSSSQPIRTKIKRLVQLKPNLRMCRSNNLSHNLQFKKILHPHHHLMLNQIPSLSL